MAKKWNNPTQKTKTVTKSTGQKNKNIDKQIKKVEKKIKEVTEKIEKPIITMHDKIRAEQVVAQFDKTKGAEFFERDNFKDYELRTVDFMYNGLPTYEQIVFRKDKYVTSFSDRYRLLPNEDMVKLCDELAPDYGAKPVELAPRDWFYMKPKEHVFYSKDEHSCGAIYLMDKEFEVVPGDKLKMGFVAMNSIDGSCAFSVAAFDFRMVCQNMMMHIASPKMIQDAQGDYLGVKTDTALEEIREHQVQTLSAITKKHISTLDIKFVKHSIKSVLDSANDIIKRYRELNEAKMTQEKAQMIVNSFATSTVKEQTWLEIDKEWQVKKAPKVTQWEAFNGLTESLTHNKKLNFGSTLWYMKKVDQIFVTPDAK